MYLPSYINISITCKSTFYMYLKAYSYLVLVPDPCTGIWYKTSTRPLHRDLVQD